MIRSPQEKKKLEIEEGAGKKLGDIPYGKNLPAFALCYCATLFIFL